MLTLEQLTAYVRDLTGVYSADIVSDTLIARWLNEAYAEVCRAADWPFLETTQYADVAAGTSLVSLPLASRRILEVVFLDEDGNRQVVTPVASTLAVGSYGAPRYDVEDGAIVLAPTPVKPVVVQVRYQQAPPALSAPEDAPVFRDDFHPILAYSAAVKVLTVQADQTGRAAAFQAEMGSIAEDMRSEYLSDHDKGLISMGGDATGGELPRWSLL